LTIYPDSAEITRESPPLARRDRRSTRLAPADVICVSCVRNESLRLPYFLEYYRTLGVGRFFFIDNDSTDGTLQYLLDQGDVHVYSAAGSYAESRCGVLWTNQVLHAHARGHWALTVDADELLIYPDCERLGLQALTRRLQCEGAGCLQAFMLDMYSDRPIRETVYERGMDFLAACPFFDAHAWVERGERNLPQRGGPRHRLFWAGRSNPKPSPFLEKFPLAKWGPDVRYEASTHRLAGSTPAAMTGVLLHFKFFSSLFAEAAEEAARGEHWDGAWQYQTYWNVLRDDPDITAFHGGSLRYTGSFQLVELGLMKAGDPVVGGGRDQSCSS
jgi:hypothetical protein